MEPTQPSTSSAGEAAVTKRSSLTQIKRKPEDFIFGRLIGDGSFSSVYLAKEVSTGKEYAIKVLEKSYMIKERKTEYVMREKEVLSRMNHPFFVRLYYTFQDKDRLYFVLSLARRGELLDYIKKLGCFDENCSRFYAAEIVIALEYLHNQGMVHRDLKPENILLNDDMHIQITDFGSAKVFNKEKDEEKTEKSESSTSKDAKPQRRRSFVGTAQYVSPEILTGKPACYSSDLWALGCIIYQFLSGQLPFWGGHEYQIFQKITKLEYEFPEGFNPVAKDLIQKLLVLDADTRLGCEGRGGFAGLKAHPFFEGINWDVLHEEKPPELLPYLPAKDEDSKPLWGSKPGMNLSAIIGHEMGESTVEKKSQVMSEDDVKHKIELQAKENIYHKFTEGNFILKQGIMEKRKGFSVKRRMFLLTEGPRLFYVDPQAMVLKGEIPWSNKLRTEAKNFKIFFVHTPNRTYYLEDLDGNALKWCKKIDEVRDRYYGNKDDEAKQS